MGVSSQIGIYNNHLEVHGGAAVIIIAQKKSN
jgi:hypothetical protein